MNKSRAKTIADLALRLQDIENELETVAGEEREAYDNMPEGLQDGERGQQTSDNADELESLQSDLEDIIGRLSAVGDSL